VRLELRYDSGRIAERVASVAGEIDQHLRGRALVVVSILKGSAFFMADLARRLRGSFSCQYLHVRRVEGAHDVLQIDFTTGFTVRDKHVLLLKDVVHTGVIETYLMDQLRSEGAQSLSLAAIVDKPRDRKTAVSVDFSLFSADQGGVFAGYGMEYEGLHANLPDIFEVLPGPEVSPEA
jgi:hypoxanthine phosphoribosyltransferase